MAATWLLVSNNMKAVNKNIFLESVGDFKTWMENDDSANVEDTTTPLHSK